ncbi:MAG TPA: hypothetical protein VGP69_04570, partial [Gaiellaceae bacterium]|nr:hypothetical protein [Gaiellaceae bacterium]
IESQLATERARLDAAAAHGLECWVWLGSLTNLPAGAPSPQERLLTQVVEGLRGHPALGAWKGQDEPRNPFDASLSVPPANLVRGHRALNALDPDHALVVIQAPRGTVKGLVPYRPAFDITGVDIYPIGYPPGAHTDQKNKDISVVGDVARWIKQAAGTKPFWLTLQIAWSGVIPTVDKPGIVPRFPSAAELRFMGYQAIVNGARGLVFFGGHLTEVLSPADARAGWNWSYWERALRPLVQELSSDSLAPALTAPAATTKVTASSGDIELAVRRTDAFLFVIAVRRGGGTTRVTLRGLPASLRGGQVLFEYVQDPPPPPIDPTRQKFRSVAVTSGALTDWFAPHDVHVYRFAL